METPLEKTGIIYTRVSSTEQVENTSLGSQERLCYEYAKREGINILKVFVEKGESAKTADRTEFIKAINFCSKEKGKVGYFIVFKFDRFSRSVADHAATRVALNRVGTVVRSVSESTDESSAGKAMEGMISVFAEFDNNVRTERSKAGMLEQLKKGMWVWQAPIGCYRPRTASRLEKDPSAAPYILTIFEEYAKGGYSYESLAEHLAKRGFKTKTGKRPFPQLIEKIIKNPLYCGIMRVWGEDYLGNFEPLISEELFEQCQRGWRKKTVVMGKVLANPEFPLRRVCVCPECKKSFTGSKSRGRKISYPYYHHQKQGCSKAKFIPKEIFEQIFLEYLSEISPNLEFEKIFRAIVLDIWKNNYKKFDENNAKIRVELERLEKERQKVFDLHRSGKYSDAEFLEQKNVINENMYSKRQLLQDNHIEEFNMEEALDHCFRYVRQAADTWLRLKKKNYAYLMRFQKQVFPEKITFNGEKFGTDKLSLIYKLNKENGTDKSKLVHPAGFEPATIRLRGDCSTN
jgi:site-specific DNA recombinase